MKSTWHPRKHTHDSIRHEFPGTTQCIHTCEFDDTISVQQRIGSLNVTVHNRVPMQVPQACIAMHMSKQQVPCCPGGCHASDRVSGLPKMMEWQCNCKIARWLTGNNLIRIAARNIVRQTAKGPKHRGYTATRAQLHEQAKPVVLVLHTTIADNICMTKLAQYGHLPVELRCSAHIFSINKQRAGQPSIEVPNTERTVARPPRRSVEVLKPRLASLQTIHLLSHPWLLRRFQTCHAQARYPCDMFRNSRRTRQMMVSNIIHVNSWFLHLQSTQLAATCGDGHQ